MIPNEREIYLMHAINEKNDEYWDLRQEIEQEKKRRPILVMAGIAAAQKWDNIDLTKVNVKFVDSLEPFKVRKPLLQAVSEPLQETVPMPPSDDMIFRGDNSARWRKDNTEFWLAWGPVTNTLAIAILDQG